MCTELFEIGQSEIKIKNGFLVQGDFSAIKIQEIISIYKTGLEYLHINIKGIDYCHPHRFFSENERNLIFNKIIENKE